MLRAEIDPVTRESMVRQMAQQFATQGYRVLANVLGYPTPMAIDGQVPDIAAIKGDLMIIIQMDTPTTYKARILTPTRNLAPFLLQTNQTWR